MEELVLKRTWTAVATAAGVLACAVPAAASPVHGQAGQPSVAAAVAVKDVTNGSFETPGVASGTWARFTSGQTMGGWQLTSGSVELVNGYWQAADGQQSVDLSGTEPGSISQTLATTPGTTYVVTYALAGNPLAQTPAIRTGQVLVDGQAVQDFSFDVTGKTAGNMGYVTKRVAFEAAGTSTTVTFASTTASAYGPVIDKVSVNGCACGV
jgi:choice-of-anchor C domain-containing protein